MFHFRSRKAADEAVHDISMYYQLNLDIERIRYTYIIPLVSSDFHNAAPLYLRFCIINYAMETQSCDNADIRSVSSRGGDG